MGALRIALMPLFVASRRERTYLVSGEWATLRLSAEKWPQDKIWENRERKASEASGQPANGSRKRKFGRWNRNSKNRSCRGHCLWPNDADLSGCGFALVFWAWGDLVWACLPPTAVYVGGSRKGLQKELSGRQQIAKASRKLTEKCGLYRFAGGTTNSFPNPPARGG
jgi:hypothetical protein